MIEKKNNRVILIADDDAEDCMFIREALAENGLEECIHFVENGEELMDYLHNSSNYSDTEKYPAPDLILLDLNMPRKDGREALKEIKADPQLRHIPVVVLTTSKAEEDILKIFDLGVNAYITKPVSFSGMVDMVKTLSDYWFELVQLPELTKGTIFTLKLPEKPVL